MSPNTDSLLAEVTAYLGRRLGRPAEFVDDVAWQKREALLDAGRIHVAYLCGLPYVWKADRPEPVIELLAAPVMRGERYRDRPIYFSDVVVRRDSPFRTFADLEGASWAYNQPDSHAGYNVVRYHLAQRGAWSGYFGRVVSSGALLASLEMVLEGRIDATAIDSIVLEQEMRDDPALGDRIRVVDSLGPSPAPPLVVLRRLPAALRRDLRRELLAMHRDDEGRAILERGHVARFARVDDGDYDDIRRMAAMAESVLL